MKMRQRHASERLFALIWVILLVLLSMGCRKGEGSGVTWTPRILSDPNIYLPNFSYSGYHWGESALPELTATLSATEFGAVPNDGKDDTQALKAAFAAALDSPDPVVLALPAGRLILTDILYIERSNFVLQGSGSGPDGTILYMPQPLNTLPTPEDLVELEEYLMVYDKRQREPERGIDSTFSLYAWSGGYIWSRVRGARAKTYMPKYNTVENVLAKITTGSRGGHEVSVESADRLRVDQVVRINWYNKEGEHSSLIEHMYDNKPVIVGSRHWESPDMPVIKQEVTIKNIEGTVVTLKEPLLHDLRPEWYPTFTEWKYLEEIGIEHIRFEFAYEDYFAHHLEAGYNAIYFTNTAHSWVRDISIHDGDSGFLSDICTNVTVQDMAFTGRTYHYAVHFGDVYNLLAKNIIVDCVVKHSLSFNTGARSCVFTNSLVTTVPSLDQHSGANHQNLFDNIKVIENDPGRTFFYMGGDGYWAPTHGAFSTFWNIRVDFTFDVPDELPLKIKGVTNGPSARLVGLTANYPMDITYGPDAYMEGINNANLGIPSLYDYQLNKRLGNESE